MLDFVELVLFLFGRLVLIRAITASPQCNKSLGLEIQLSFNDKILSSGVKIRH